MRRSGAAMAARRSVSRSVRQAFHDAASKSRRCTQARPWSSRPFGEEEGVSPNPPGAWSHRSGSSTTWNGRPLETATPGGEQPLGKNRTPSGRSDSGSPPPTVRGDVLMRIPPAVVNVLNRPRTSRNVGSRKDRYAEPRCDEESEEPLQLWPLAGDGEADGDVILARLIAEAESETRRAES